MVSLVQGPIYLGVWAAVEGAGQVLLVHLEILGDHLSYGYGQGPLMLGMNHARPAVQNLLSVYLLSRDASSRGKIGSKP